MHGPPIRTDIVEVYVFRRPRVAEGGRATLAPSDAVEFLQLRRTKGPMPGTWQPVMGHIEFGETAVQAALRELREETGLSSIQDDSSRRPKHAGGVLAMWQLELVNMFFLASANAVMCSPGFAAEAAPDADIMIDDAHDAYRWVPRGQADRLFLWPGQRAAIRHLVDDLLTRDSPLASPLRINPP